MVHNPGYDFNDGNIAVGVGLLGAAGRAVPRRRHGSAVHEGHRSRRRPARRHLRLLPAASSATKSPSSTARPRRPPKPASPTAGRSRSATPSPGPTRARRSRCCKWLGKEDAPLLFRLRADMRQWLWGLQFLRECTPARTRHNIEQIVRLGTYSRDTLQAAARATPASTTTSARRASCTSTRAQKEFDGALKPGRADARARLRPAA